MVACSFTNSVVVRSNLFAVSSTSDMAPVSSKEFFDIQATTECKFTLRPLRDMIITYSQMHRSDKYSQHSSIMTSWLNGWVFFVGLSVPNSLC